MERKSSQEKWICLNFLSFNCSCFNFRFFLTADEPCPASLYGLTAWRILSGYPHYNLIEDDGTQLIKVTFIFSESLLVNFDLESVFFFFLNLS